MSERVDERTQPGQLVQPRERARPIWARWRYWLALLGILLVAAVVVGLLAQAPTRTLDPHSARPSGGRALADLLARYGTKVTPTTSIPTRGATVLLIDPDAYSSRQLRKLVETSSHLVAVQPGTRATQALVPGLQPSSTAAVEPVPDCDYAAAQAAGSVRLPGDSIGYVPARNTGTTATRCYGGVVTVSAHVVVLGSAELLENRSLARPGVAALAINTVSNDRTASSVRWLFPGADAAGPGPASVWSLFPDGVHRVVLWLLAVGGLTVLWRARRLGPAVRERLPVVVRSAEIVEGHGRLYERAGDRARAADALRGATLRRLIARYALPRSDSPAQVAAAVTSRLDRPPGEVWTTLAGPPPSDDLELTRLAADLDRLETALIANNPTEENAR